MLSLKHTRLSLPVRTKSKSVVAWQSCLVVWQAHVFGGCTALPMSALALGLHPCAVMASAHSHCGVEDLSVGEGLCTELRITFVIKPQKHSSLVAKHKCKLRASACFGMP